MGAFRSYPMAEFNLTPFKANNKTLFLAQEYERLLSQYKEVEEMAKDPALSELAKTDAESLKRQLETLR